MHTTRAGLRTPHQWEDLRPRSPRYIGEPARERALYWTNSSTAFAARHFGKQQSIGLKSASTTGSTDWSEAPTSTKSSDARPTKSEERCTPR